MKFDYFLKLFSFFKVMQSNTFYVILYQSALNELHCNVVSCSFFKLIVYYTKITNFRNLTKPIVIFIV